MGFKLNLKQHQLTILWKKNVIMENKLGSKDTHSSKIHPFISGEKGKETPFDFFWLAKTMPNWFYWHVHTTVISHLLGQQPAHKALRATVF
jgi:hypothetical protein